MKTIIDSENRTIDIYNDDGERLLSVFLSGEHAVWEKIGDEDIILDEASASTFYENIRNLFENEYSFVYQSGNQAKNRIEFFSDNLHPVNLDSLNDITKRNRLILMLNPETEEIIIKIDTPFSDKEEENQQRVVYFNQTSKNTFRADNDYPLYEPITLQDDMIEAIQKSFKSKTLLPKRRKRLKKTA